VLAKHPVNYVIKEKMRYRQNITTILT